VPFIDRSFHNHIHHLPENVSQISILFPPDTTENHKCYDQKNVCRLLWATRTCPDTSVFWRP